jgi:hypothetical protein
VVLAMRSLHALLPLGGSDPSRRGLPEERLVSLLPGQAVTLPHASTRLAIVEPATDSDPEPVRLDIRVAPRDGPLEGRVR